MAKFLRKSTPVLTLGAMLDEAARKVEAAQALSDALLAATEAEVVHGQTAEIGTHVRFDLDAIVDCSDDGVEYRSVGAEIAEALGCELPDDGVPDAVIDLLEKLVGQVQARVRKDLEALDLETKDGNIVIKVDASTVLVEGLGNVVDTCVSEAKTNLRNAERAAIAKHNAEVREANAKVLPMTKPEPTPARRDVLAAAVEALDDPRFVEKLAASIEPTPTAPGDVVVEALEAFRKDYNYEGVAAMTKPKAKKPRAPRKAKVAPAAEAAPAAPAPVKHPVDVAEALAVLADDNATPEAIEAALALLA